MNIAGLLPILLLGVVFWALLIRPQQRARAAQRDLQNALSPGDEVTTIGGLFGIVRELDDATVDLEVSEDVIVRFDRRAVSRIVRDIPAEQADQHVIDEDDEAELDEVAEAHADETPEASAEQPAPAAEPEIDDPTEPVDAPEPAR